jgi:DNA-directed RNA polymerase subunit RPC12/RpoP
MLKCDFCGKDVETVSRVALDKGYDRLTVKHSKMYACLKCSKKKEDKRLETTKRKAFKTS